MIIFCHFFFFLGHDLALHRCEEAVVAVEVKNLLGEETVVGVEKEDDPGLGVEKGTREDLVQEKEKDELGVSNYLFFFFSLNHLHGHYLTFS